MGWSPLALWNRLKTTGSHRFARKAVPAAGTPSTSPGPIVETDIDRRPGDHLRYLAIRQNSVLTVREEVLRTPAI